MIELSNPESAEIVIRIFLVCISTVSFFKTMTNLMVWLNARIHDGILFQARAQETVQYVPEAIINTLMAQVKPGHKAAVAGSLWGTFTFFLISLEVFF